MLLLDAAQAQRTPLLGLVATARRQLRLRARLIDRKGVVLSSAAFRPVRPKWLPDPRAKRHRCTNTPGCQRICSEYDPQNVHPARTRARLTSYMSSNPLVSTAGRSAPRSIMLSSPAPRLPLARSAGAAGVGAAAAAAGRGLAEGTVNKSSMWAVLEDAAAADPLPLPPPKPSKSSSTAAAAAAAGAAAALGTRELVLPPLPMPSRSSSTGCALAAAGALAGASPNSCP